MTTKAIAEQPSLFDKYAPQGKWEFMTQAWMDCLMWAAGDTDCIDAFKAATGIIFNRASSPLDRMIDDATGFNRDIAEKFLVWFNANVWGDLDAPDSEEPA